MRILRVKKDFDAAHRLTSYEGACANLHGHTWHVEFFIRVNEAKMQDNGISIDFKDLKASLESILPDHAYLNDVLTQNPTAEYISKWLFEQVRDKLSLDIVKVVLWETERNGIEYFED